MRKDVKAGDNSKIALAPANGAEEVRILISIGVHDFPGKYDLEVDDIVTGEA